MNFFIHCYNLFYRNRGIGEILYGLSALVLAKIFINIRDKNDLIKKLKRFKLLHTVSECKLLQKKTEVAIQGIVQTINAENFVFLKQNCKKYERQYTQQKILILDALGAKIIGNIDGLSLKINQDAMDYNVEQLYKQFVPKEVSIFKKIFLFIKHRLFQSKIIEQTTGVSSNQYLTLVGELNTDTKNNLYINIQQMAKKPQAFYQALNNEIRQMNSIILLQSMIFCVLAGAWACGTYEALRRKNQQKQQPQIYKKKETDVLSQNELCIVCLTNARNTILLPCLHLILCDICAKEVRSRNKKCPFCRNPIEQLKLVLICSNCLAKIQESNMMIHELYCSRNVQVCMTCGEKYDVTEEDEHIQRFHIPKICKYCSQYQADPKHECPNKPMQCQYCKKQFKGNSIHNHEQSCKHKEQKCKCCHQMIQNYTMKSHVPKCQIQHLGHLEFSCNNCGLKLLSEQLLLEHEVICKQQFECPYCYFYLEEEDKKDHLNLCGSRTEKCIFCCKIILLSQRTDHQLDCYRNRLKRNLKLLKKESAKQQIIVNEQSEDADYQAYLETKKHDILILLKCLDQVHIIKMLERKSFLKLMKNYSMNQNNSTQNLTQTQSPNQEKRVFRSENLAHYFIGRYKKKAQKIKQLNNVLIVKSQSYQKIRNAMIVTKQCVRNVQMNAINVAILAA